MNHPEIEERQVVEHYVAGKLSADDEARFEEHFLLCPTCVQAIRDAERLHRGLRTVAAEDAVARRTAAVGAMAAVAALLRSRSGALLATALVAAVLLPTTLLLGARQRAARLGGELDSARHELSGTRQELAAAHQDLEGERRPRINTPILTLDPTRDGEQPLQQISLDPAGEWIVLAVELGEGLDETYTATLGSADGTVIWQSPGLVPSYRGTLSLSLHSSLLPPGHYTLSLEGESPPLVFPLEAVSTAP